MQGIWDLYLDGDDAAAVLTAAAALERHAAIREPLPLDDVHRLLARLRTIAPIAADEAGYWAHEVEDRQVEADGDGGRWGSPATAAAMLAVASDRAAACREVAAAAAAAAEDLAARLDASPQPSSPPIDRGLRDQAEQLLRTGRLTP